MSCPNWIDMSAEQVAELLADADRRALACQWALRRWLRTPWAFRTRYMTP